MRNRETNLLVAIQDGLYTPETVKAARALSHFGEHDLGWLAVATAGAIATSVGDVDRHRRSKWIALGAGTFAAHAATVVLKRIVRRKRPDYPYVRVGVKTPSKLSFPSSHATSTTAFLVAASRLTGCKAPLLGVPVMMASRMVLGVHYPTDTAVGAAIGAATAEVVMKGMKHE